MNSSNVVVSVGDNGNGIADLFQEKIFQPFFTAKPTPGREGGWDYQ